MKEKPAKRVRPHVSEKSAGEGEVKKATLPVVRRRNRAELTKGPLPKATGKKILENFTGQRYQRKQAVGEGTKIGRKLKLFQDGIDERIMDALVAGNTIRNACAMGPLSEGAFYRYMDDSTDNQKEPDELHALIEFRKAVKKAIAAAEHRNVLVINQAAPKSWQAAAWFLERRNPDDWGQKSRVAVGGDAQGVPIVTGTVSEKVLSDEEALAALQAVLQRAGKKI